MLVITVPKTTLWDERNEEFIYVAEHKLRLEHSLISIANWEAKWEKSFISTANKTDEETIDYIRFMTLTHNVDPNVYLCLTNQNVADITRYIKAPMTALKFPSEPKKKSIFGEEITAELVYYWMIQFKIPNRFEKWHFNRLYALIKLCELKQRPPKKMSQHEMIQTFARLNDERRRKYNSKG